MKLIKLCGLALAICFCAIWPASAQAPAPQPVATAQTYSDAQLDQLLGPIALYPDPLIAEILPASTLPAQIAAADGYINNGGDPSQIDQQPWDPSVQALARYPDVLKWMDDNLNWTTELGQAFLNQQQQVMDSIQRLRASANNLGNLQSTPQQQVVNDDGDIEIVPADPDEMYVPDYQPDQVYYDTADGTPYITFGVGWPIGVWLQGDFDWRNHHLIVWDRDHPRPANWWHQPASERSLGDARVWRPQDHPGAVVVNRGDRGWAASRSGCGAATSDLDGNGARAPREDNAPLVNVAHAPLVNVAHAPLVDVARPTPAPAQYSEPVRQPEENGAFIGIQSSRDTSAYSYRGQQSMQEAPRSAPAPRPEPVSRPAPSGGGGGGGGRRR